MIPNDAGEFAIRTYRPAAAEDATFPVLLVVHGGGDYFTSYIPRLNLF